MKFGDTLYQRSVPQWAAYNVNYNEIKRLIKERTSTGPSTGLAVPVHIPNTSSNNRWAALEDDLYNILKDQHDNISLFLRSKYGEIDRRLTYLERQVRSAQKNAKLPYTNQSLQTRRYHKLLEDAQSIGQDIQNLTRFAAVQKTAVRKLLKKYRKWTGSTSLQTRLEVEVFDAGQLNLDYVHPLERLATLTSVITEQLQGSPSQNTLPFAAQSRTTSSTLHSNATVSQINDAAVSGPIALDAALATVPFGKSSGLATYWIHPDNLEEAEALLLRHVHEVYKSSEISRESSNLSVASSRSRNQSDGSTLDGVRIAYFDNVQRFLQDNTSNKASKIALSARWSPHPDAVVTLSNLAPWNPVDSIINLRRKDVAKALARGSYDAHEILDESSPTAKIQRVRDYLLEHRDVKPLGQVHATRTRYVGNTNSSTVGTWVTLDNQIVISHLDNGDNLLDNNAESGEAFPHAVLEIRWEFGHTPEVVRSFDTTHLAERVRGFSLEAAAVYINNKQLTAPTWTSLLEGDIRKVPMVTKLSSKRRGSIPRGQAGTSSGTSSTDGPVDSVFSAQNGQSSATSILSPAASTRDLTSPSASKPSLVVPKRKKKKARIDAQTPSPRESRYWNEFDDGDEDVNPLEAYTITVDPNESFPGAETVSKVFGAMYTSLEAASSRVASIFSLKSRSSKSKKKRTVNERSRLLNPNSRSNSDEADSSDSDTTPVDEHPNKFGIFARQNLPSRTISSTSPLYRPHQLLTPRQVALEHTYLMFYTGLISLSYVLLFMCGVLISTGRKKATFEVDIAVVAGIVTAGICAVVSTVLIFMRRSPLSILHWTVAGTAITGIVVIGIFEIIGVVQRTERK